MYSDIYPISDLMWPNPFYRRKKQAVRALFLDKLPYSMLRGRDYSFY
jgi:hypothetical protein